VKIASRATPAGLAGHDLSTIGQAACRLLCRYTQSTLAASCVCWIVRIVTCDSIKRTCGCSCLKCTWSVA